MPWLGDHLLMVRYTQARGLRITIETAEIASLIFMHWRSKRFESKRTTEGLPVRAEIKCGLAVSFT